MRGLGLFLGLNRKRAGGAGGDTPPANITAPVVTGTGYVGYTLSTTDGVWSGSPAPTFTYQWQRNTGTWTDIAGATASTYAVTLADEGVPVRCVVTATNIAGSASANSNAIEQWVPSDGGTVRLWYDAADASTISIATGISSWTSKGTLAESSTQGTGANQPGYNATGFGGRPCATFNGSTQFLTQDVAADVLRNVTGGTVASACRIDVGSTTRAIYVVSTSSNTSTRYQLQTLSPQTARIAHRRLDGDAFAAHEIGVMTLGSPSSLIGVTNHVAGSVFGILNGTSSTPATASTGSTSNTASARRRIGSDPANTPGGFFNGAIAEILLYESTLSATNLEKLAGYLHWRWQMVSTLAGGHPYKTIPPTP